MKKKYTASRKDQKDWNSFTKELGNVYDKDINLNKQDYKKFKTKRLDLHGLSLDQANKETKKFILESFDRGYKKLLIITGKGLRSKSYDNPYVSEQLSVLRYAVPEFISNDTNLNEKVIKISTADIKDGGEGAINILLKSNKNL